MATSTEGPKFIFLDLAQGSQIDRVGLKHRCDHSFLFALELEVTETGQLFEETSCANLQ
jgi:hypothetical protein